MLRRHLQRCADGDLLASTSAEMPSTSATVQRQAPMDSQYSVLPAVVMSAVYSVLLWTKKLKVGV